MAKDIRRGSWGMGAVAVATGIHAGQTDLAAAGAMAWVLLQLIAFVVDGLEEGQGGHDEL